MKDNILDSSQIHWFPGHMMRTLRRIEPKLALVDAVVQLLDARIPLASLNPDLQAIYGTKPRLYILNKSDLADDAITSSWVAYLKTSENAECVAINSKQKGGANLAKSAVENTLSSLFLKRKEKGISGAKVRLMITGIPNVGKSTFINSWAGGAPAKAADKPGVTRGEQWVNAGKYELLDIPGVLYKRFEKPEIAVNLALIGAIPDNLLNTEEIACGLLFQLEKDYKKRLQERYRLDESDFCNDTWQLLCAVGKKRGMLISGGQVDTQRASIMLLDEFRGGKLGKISLEKIEDN